MIPTDPYALAAVYVGDGLTEAEAAARVGVDADALRGYLAHSMTDERPPPEHRPPYPASPANADDPRKEPTTESVTGEGDPLPGEPWTELGYARRLVHVYGDRLRYVAAWRRWLVWDGKRWARDETGRAHRYAKHVARLMTTVAEQITDDGVRKALRSATRRGESSAGVAGVLTLAASDARVAVTPEQLDARPLLLNCQNGTLDLATGKLRPHDPADLLTKVTSAAYDPAAAGEVWATFLARVQPDPAQRDYLARQMGHALEGRVTEHLLPVYYGDGANGKGTFVGAILAALGDYADAADPDLLIARSFDAHPTSVADLFGLRLAVLHETDAGRRLAEATVKRLTGGDRLKARRMREDFWAFDPSHSFVMLTNHKPIITGQDEGIWRRVRLVPWPVVIPPDERDDRLPARLAAEADAVLAWLVAGYHAFRTQGLNEPESVTEATRQYRLDSDALGRFLDDRCLIMAGYTVRSSELFSEWVQWCAVEGEEAGTNKAFTAAMEARGFDKHKSHGVVRWQGLGLAAADDGSDDR